MARKNKFIKAIEKKYQIKIERNYVLQFLLSDDPEFTEFDFDTYFLSDPNDQRFGAEIFLAGLPLNTTLSQIIINSSCLEKFNSTNNELGLAQLVEAFKANTSLKKIIITHSRFFPEPLNFSFFFDFIRQIQIEKPNCKIEIAEFNFAGFTVADMQQWIEIWQNPPVINQLSSYNIFSIKENATRNLFIEWLSKLTIKNLKLNIDYLKINNDEKVVIQSILEWQNITEWTICKNYLCELSLEDKNELNAYINSHPTLNTIKLDDDVPTLFSGEEFKNFLNSLKNNSNITSFHCPTARPSNLDSVIWHFTGGNTIFNYSSLSESFIQFLETNPPLMELNLQNFRLDLLSNLHSERFFNAILGMNKLKELNLNLDLFHLALSWKDFNPTYFYSQNKQYENEVLFTYLPKLLTHSSLEKLNLCFRLLKQAKNIYQLLEKTTLTHLDITGNGLDKSKLAKIVKNHPTLIQLTCKEILKAPFNNKLLSNQIARLQTYQSELFNLQWSEKNNFPNALIDTILSYTTDTEILSKFKEQQKEAKLEDKPIAESKPVAHRFNLFSCFAPMPEEKITIVATEMKLPR